MKGDTFTTCAIVALMRGPGSVCAEHALAIMQCLRDEGRIDPVLVCLDGTEIHERARAAGFEAVPLRSASWWRPATVWRLRRLARLPGRLLIQTFGETAALLGYRLFGLCRGVGNILSHAFLMHPPSPSFCRSEALRAARCVLYGSAHIRDVMARECRELGNFSGQLMIPLPPGMPPLTLTGGVWQPERRFVFAMGNSLIKNSGAFMTVRAMAAVWQREDVPHWELLMLGNGPRYGEVLLAAEKLGVLSRLGLLSEQELAAIMPNVHVWLAPGSDTEEEPLTLGAGLAAGLPVVCSRSPLHVDRLRDAPDAVKWIDMENPQGLAGVMIDLMRNASLRDDLAERSRKSGGLLAMARAARRAVSLFEEWGSGQGVA
ncbi:MAG: glycosyltransferase family 4 protein [Desulfovibrio sp.]|jgi:glycosyltransferase involved in cell wall biosynthesis|nr:glycosyltransferase family 4 protein [Desulfovibrio sp.]